MKKKPNPVYRVIGLSQVTEYMDGIFARWSYGAPVERAEAGIAVQLPTQSHTNRLC